MIVDWSSLLVQVPLVVAFIWFATQTQKTSQDSMDKRDQAFFEALEKRDALYETRNGAIVNALTAETKQLGELTTAMSNHDSWTRQAVNQMFDRAEDRSDRQDRNDRNARQDRNDQNDRNDRQDRVPRG